MMARTHLVFGLFSGALLLGAATNEGFIHNDHRMVFLFLVGTALGSLLPDIDEPHSFIGRKFLFLSYPINIVFRHRMFTHSMVFVVILALILALLNTFFYIPYFYMGIVFGVLAHIIGDMHTKGGCPIFLPISKKKIKILPDVLSFKTGSFVEYLFTISYTALLLFVIKYFFLL